ncbi:MAG: geranylgeranylglyceryl/heptaprenylglyceryl phosphate synthase [Candidatus Aenigmarchaeota archaeon]|nr:geranylgeranylglyceryl/heptaprenylglyceryl phosphate synthase [Candidatus Aenigmarchaeota archaeon]
MKKSSSEEVSEPPVLHLLWDPAERKRYPQGAFECAKDAHRNLVGGSDKVTRENMERMIETLKKYTDKPIYEFPGDKDQVTGKANGIFTPCVANSRYTKFFSDLQAEFEPKLTEIYGRNVEWVWYLALGGKVAKAARAKKMSREQIIKRFEYWTKFGNFSWYYLEAGSGERMLPLSLILECNKICQDRRKKFIYGGGIRKFEQAKPLYENKVNIVVGNALLYPEGISEIRKIQKKLYRA